ncbi:MAG: hypothetical protein SCG73_04305 [Nitrospiraceae bacterium]|nr:hypothetical protein [Nitrospiraceae bacterium]
MLDKVSRALVAQLAVRPELVVAVPEVFDDHTGLGQRPELLTVQALVAEAAMDSSGARKPAAGSPKGSAGGRWQPLHKAALPRAAGIDVDGLDAVLRQPLPHDLGDELAAVVAAQSVPSDER